MTKFDRSHIKKFIYSSLNNKALNESINFMGNELEVVDEGIIFNGQRFDLNTFKTVLGVTAPIGLSVKSVDLEEGFLKVILEHPITGEDIPIVFKDQMKAANLMSMLQAGENFIYKVSDQEGEEKQIGFTSN
jgi:hypothetical protein